jgi:hypothetical protein
MDVQVNDKAVKFRTLAERRVSVVVRKLRQIGNLSRRSSYTSTELEVEQMFAAMRNALDTAYERFKADPQAGFRFD